MESHYMRQQTTRQYLASNLIKKNIKMLVLCCHHKMHTEGSLVNPSTWGFTSRKRINAPCAWHTKMLELRRKRGCKIIIMSICLTKAGTRNEAALQGNSKWSRRSQSALFWFAKVLPTPFGENGEFYYVSKFSVYNLTVYDLDTKQGYCYMWDEIVSQRGQSEVGSCLYTHLGEQSIQLNSYITLFADNCPGQNRNHFLRHSLLLFGTYPLKVLSWYS